MELQLQWACKWEWECQDKWLTPDINTMCLSPLPWCIFPTCLMYYLCCTLRLCIKTSSADIDFTNTDHCAILLTFLLGLFLSLARNRILHYNSNRVNVKPRTDGICTTYFQLSSNLCILA